MASNCKIISGTRNDCLTCNPEQVIIELNRGKFLINSNQGTYSAEKYTLNYINSIFETLSSVEKFWNQCKTYAENYIKEFNEYPEPDSIIDDTIYLDEEISDNDNINDLDKMIGEVTATSLNIRKSPNTQSPIVGVYNNGDKVEILEYSSNKNWIKVKTSNGEEAYISSKYVSIQETNNNSSMDYKKSQNIKFNTPKQNISLQTAIVNTPTSGLNFFADSNINSPIYAFIPIGTKIDVLDYDDNQDWVKIVYNGQEGYVYKKYIKMEGE